MPPTSAVKAAMLRNITIEIGVPDPCLMPNRASWGRQGGMRKSAAVKAGRANAKFAAAARLGELACDAPRWKAARISPTFYVRTTMGLSADPMNRIASLKAAVDGLADAGLFLNDRGVQWGKVSHGIDEFSPHVELFIEEIVEAERLPLGGTLEGGGGP